MFKGHYLKGLTLVLVLMLAAGTSVFAAGGEQKSEPSSEYYYVGGKVMIETYDKDNLARTKKLYDEKLWVGENDIAEISGGRITYLDFEKNQAVLINLQNRTYVTTSMPVKLENIFTQKRLSELRAEKRTGKVKRLKMSREIMGLKCRSYQFTTKTRKKNGDIQWNRMIVWASTRVPFELKNYYRLLECLRTVYNRDKKERRQLGKIKGLQLRIENPQVQKGKRVKYISETVEISKKAPPYPGIEALIKTMGLTKKEKFGQ
jgi:hypothetical protein